MINAQEARKKYIILSENVEEVQETITKIEEAINNGMSSIICRYSGKYDTFFQHFGYTVNRNGAGWVHVSW